MECQRLCPDINTSLLILEDDLNDNGQAVEINLSYALCLQFVIKKSGTRYCFDMLSYQVFEICIELITFTVVVVSFIHIYIFFF